MTCAVRPLLPWAPNALSDAILVHLERLGSLSEETVRFYVAELASALSFLHEKRIMHRFVFSLHSISLPRFLSWI